MGISKKKDGFALDLCFNKLYACVKGIKKPSLLGEGFS
jgi:hypothetical protein